MFTAHIRITLRPSILDPQGKAIRHALHDLGMGSVGTVRTGKFIEMTVDAESPEAAEATVRQSCEKLLANPVTEDFEILALMPADEVPA
jgi:phosphoribosylformylglycinamidine synthase subunit PurS